MPAAGCGSTRWRGSCRTSRSTTSGRRAGALPEHLWFVRRIRVDVLVPFLVDRAVELTTWCSGVAAIAAGRRWTVKGDRGGHLEVDSVWIHLDAEGRPARIAEFGPYREAAGTRTVSTRFELPDPPSGVARSPWALRSADVDLHGHVNNAVHWQAVEHALIASGAVAPNLPTGPSSTIASRSTWTIR